MAQRYSSKPIDTSEGAWERAKSDFHHGARFIAWTILWEAVGIAAGVYLSWHHGLWAQVVITVGTFLAGTGIAFGTVFGALWVTAPVRQRDDAYEQLDELTAPRPFPDIAVEADEMHQSLQDRDGKAILDRDHLRLRLAAQITNREPTKRVSLDFEVLLLRDGGGSTRLLSEQRNETPLIIGPQDTKKIELTFFVHEQLTRGIADERVVEERRFVSIPSEVMRLGIRDLVSDERIEMQIPGYYGTER